MLPRTNKIRVGQLASWEPAGLDKVQVRVVEDRGNIGFGGRRIYRVLWATHDPEVESSFEVPAEELRQIRAGNGRKTASRNGKRPAASSRR